ncbi:auxin efflux carrier [Brachyspira hampsonii 30446]|uniref:Auxin efflux carrier n=2 Tax=Brachyspira hampsonii TaxID=1287055 RepID=A0A2U4FI79_9SPIR|nr:auxin efflux carrier [Brachyspira hampsonii]EKV56921.1 auxin efflux carrier [Brachyspira hampsonii 30446]OEJ18270.1 transporter [Brachyspira hampsonii]
MYTIIELILPIFVLIAFGKILKHFNIISNEGIKTIKNLAVNLFLPFTFFNIIIHGTFNKDSIVLIIAGFIIIFAAYLLGFLYKPLFTDNIKKYVPYTNTCIESGMFALAVLNMIIGKDNLFQIIQMDMVNNIFVFTVVTTGLTLISGNKQSAKQIIKSIFQSPIIISLILGIIGALFNLGEKIDNSNLSSTYNRIISFLTEPLSPMILICIGAELEFEIDIFKKAIKLFFVRFATMAVLISLTLFVMSKIIVVNSILVKSMIIYFLSPSPFILLMYTNNDKINKFISGFLSLQIIMSLIFCIIISFV